MEVDLRELENKLKNLLAELDAREGKLKEEVRAIELVKQASEAGQATATAVSTPEGSSPESTPPDPEGTSPAKLPSTMEAPLRIQEDELPQEESAPAEASAETAVPQETSVESPAEPEAIVPALEMAPEAATTSPPEPAAEPEPAPEATVAEEEPPSSKAVVSDTPAEDAVLAVLRSWDTRLKSAKIAEELIAAGYPFPTGNPRDLVANVLQDMARDNKIKKVKTIKGTYFMLL